MGLSTPDPERLKEAASEIEALEDIDAIYKIDIILVLAGEKTTIEVPIQFRDETQGKPKKMKEKLEALGLECELLPIENRGETGQSELMSGVTKVNNLIQWIVVGRSQDDVQQFREAWSQMDDKKMGELFGFPASAVSRYTTCKEPHKEMIGIRDLPREITESEWAPFCQFALSRENWQEEIETPKRWSEVIREYAPKLYEEFQAMKKQQREQRMGKGN